MKVDVKHLGIGVVGGTGPVPSIPIDVASELGTNTASDEIKSEDHTKDVDSATIGEGCTDG